MASPTTFATGLAFVLLGIALIWWAKPVATFVLSFYTTDEPSPNLIAAGTVWVVGLIAVMNGLRILWAAFQTG